MKASDQGSDVPELAEAVQKLSNEVQTSFSQDDREEFELAQFTMSQFCKDLGLAPCKIKEPTHVPLTLKL